MSNMSVQEERKEQEVQSTTTAQVESSIDEKKNNTEVNGEEEKEVKQSETQEEKDGESNGVVEESVAEHSTNNTNNNDDDDINNDNEVKEPEVTPALATEGGREVSHKILYVGDLDNTITEEQLSEIFSVDGDVQSVKILADKNHHGFNYAFVEYEDEKSSEAAFVKLNGYSLNGTEIKINWAYQSQQAKNDPNSFNIFVGDLSSEVNDETLRNSFKKFKSLLQAHVMWDMQSGRSRGYGFVSFAEQKDAEDALNTMNGVIIANRAIRLNWASHKQQNNVNGGYRNNYHNNNHHHNPHNSNNHHHNNHHHHHNNPYQNNHHHRGSNHYAQYGQIPINGSNPNLINNGSISSPASQLSPTGGVLPSNLLAIQNTVDPLSPGYNIPTNGSSNGHQQLNQQQQQQQQPQQLQQQQQQQQQQSLQQQQVQPPIISPQSYDLVLRKAPSWQTTVYLGNLARFTTQNDLIPLLQNFGFIVDLRFLPEKNCAFVKYDSHERAALAIVQLNGFIIHGRPLKSGWGKDRSNNGLQYQNYGPIVYGQGR